MERNSLQPELKPRRGFDSLNLAHTVVAGIILLNASFLLYRNDCAGQRAFALIGFFFGLGWLVYLLLASAAEFSNPAVQRMVGSAGYIYLIGHICLGAWAAVVGLRARNGCGPHWHLWMRVTAAFGLFTALALASHALMVLLRRYNKRRFILGHPEGLHIDHPQDYGLAGAESYLAY